MKIISAAVKYKDIIFSLPPPNRHNEVLNKMYHLFIISASKLSRFNWSKDQGFLTDKGDFVDRKQAMIIALQSEQVQKGNTIHPDDLFSEDLW